MENGIRLIDQESKDAGAAETAQKTWETLEPIYDDMTDVSARLCAIVHLLENRSESIDRSAIPGLASMMEREEKEIDRLSGELKDALRELRPPRGATA